MIIDCNKWGNGTEIVFVEVREAVLGARVAAKHVHGVANDSGAMRSPLLRSSTVIANLFPLQLL
jgi:hypothetical protein